MAIEEIHVGGSCRIEVTIMDDTAVVDISTATSKEIWIFKPGATVRNEYAATFSATGVNGKMYYDVPGSYHDVAGIYTFEGEVVIAGKTYPSSTDTYEVFATI